MENNFSPLCDFTIPVSSDGILLLKVFLQALSLSCSISCLFFFNRFFVCKETLKPYCMEGLILSHLLFFPSVKSSPAKGSSGPYNALHRVIYRQKYSIRTPTAAEEYQHKLLYIFQSSRLKLDLWGPCLGTRRHLSLQANHSYVCGPSS